jgi:hypothetical protein
MKQDFYKLRQEDEETPFVWQIQVSYRIVPMKMCTYTIVKENIRQQGALFVALWMEVVDLYPWIDSMGL